MFGLMNRSLHAAAESDDNDEFCPNSSPNVSSKSNVAITVQSLTELWYDLTFLFELYYISTLSEQ